MVKSLASPSIRSSCATVALTREMLTTWYFWEFPPAFPSYQRCFKISSMAKSLSSPSIRSSCATVEFTRRMFTP
eukprot:5581717-Karenia_brevis.AAC.1